MSPDTWHLMKMAPETYFWKLVKNGAATAEIRSFQYEPFLAKSPHDSRGFVVTGNFILTYLALCKSKIGVTVQKHYCTGSFLDSRNANSRH